MHRSNFHARAGVPYRTACAAAQDAARFTRTITCVVTDRPVTIVINGAIVAGSAPAWLVGGRVFAPLTPIVVRLSSRIVYAPDAESVWIERAGARVLVRIVHLGDDVAYVELSPVLQRLGASASFDRATWTLTIVYAGAEPIATPTPFDPAQSRDTLPAATPAAPPPVTPHAAESSAPRPRRTAIPGVPSQPPPPGPAPTIPRRSAS